VCKYCNCQAGIIPTNNKYLEYSVFPSGVKQPLNIRIEEHIEYGGRIIISSPTSDVEIPIKYCPKCGRMI
jgi:hypothetical protein